MDTWDRNHIFSPINMISVQKPLLVGMPAWKIKIKHAESFHVRFQMCLDEFLGEKHHLCSLRNWAEIIHAILLGINTGRAEG